MNIKVLVYCKILIGSIPLNVITKKEIAKNKVQVVRRERCPSDQVYISTKLKFVDSEVHQQMDLKSQIT